MAGLRLLSETIPKVASMAFSRKYIMLGRLVTHWPEIVGPDLAARTQPLKLRYSKAKEGGKATAALDIGCATAEATLLHYQKDLIIERINQIFGERWVTAIRFVPQAANAPSRGRRLPAAAKPLTQEEKEHLSVLLDGVADPELQDRLKKLGSAILQERKS